MKTPTNHRPSHFFASTLLVLGLTFGVGAQAKVWQELSVDEQTILRPLRLIWNDLSPEQQNSWQKRVPRLTQLPADKLSDSQDRMAEWASLSQKQREQVQERIKNHSLAPASTPNTRAKLWQDYIQQ